MLGAIVGDIVGSIYEFNNIKHKNFLLFTANNFFTDDSVMTFAIYSALKKCKGNYKSLSKLAIKQMKQFGKLYPNSSKISYGTSFANWLNSKNPQPYNSFGNGSAMRVSPVAYFAKTEEEVKSLSKIVTEVTHNHPEGVKGAEATAMAIFLALQKNNKEEIKRYIETTYYSLNFNYSDLIENYTFNETCQNTVPQAIYCFLISNSFEDAVRTAISIGGDSDTLCAITASIAEAFYGVPENIEISALNYLDKRLTKLLLSFKKTFK